jgi:hypothetical protein
MMLETFWITLLRACKLQSKKVTLSRKQILELATYLHLAKNIDCVTIEQTQESGIGPSHLATFHNVKTELTFQQEITDVEVW